MLQSFLTPCPLRAHRLQMQLQCILDHHLTHHHAQGMVADEVQHNTSHVHKHTKHNITRHMTYHTTHNIARNKVLPLAHHVKALVTSAAVTHNGPQSITPPCPQRAMPVRWDAYKATIAYTITMLTQLQHLLLTWCTHNMTHECHL